MRMLFRIIGCIALLAGLFFAAQGSGYIPWPHDSFMVSDVRWITYGALIAAAGLLVLLLARPRG